MNNDHIQQLKWQKRIWETEAIQLSHEGIGNYQWPYDDPKN
jgi:hypothetical protein